MFKLFKSSPKWKVNILPSGPGGYFEYVEGANSVRFDWEYGGGNGVVVIIWVPKAEGWDDKHPWARGRLTEILHRVAEDVIRQKAPTCKAEFNESKGWINLREST